MVRIVVSMREAHLSPPRLPSPKHRPIVENGTFSTGPFVRNRREPRPGTPLRGSTDTSRLSEGGPGAGAPHGILAGPRQPLVPFPCGKGTRASADARNSLKQHPKPRPCAPHPRSQHRITKVFRHYRTIRRQRWRCLFCHLLLAEISIYLQ